MCISTDEHSTKGGAALSFAAGLKAFSSCPLWAFTQRGLWWRWSLTLLRPHYVNECAEDRDIFRHTGFESCAGERVCHFAFMFKYSKVKDRFCKYVKAQLKFNISIFPPLPVQLFYMKESHVCCLQFLSCGTEWSRIASCSTGRRESTMDLLSCNWAHSICWEGNQIPLLVVPPPHTCCYCPCAQKDGKE